MKLKHPYMFLSLLAVFSLVLAACQPAPTAESTAAPAATEAPAATATEAPTEMPQTTRHGGWLDEIDFSVVASDSAISQVKAGAVDMYSYQLASSDLPAIKESGLNYTSSYGGSYSIMLNPATFKDTSKLNPFSDRKIREALNWLIDRDYINQEIYGGGSLPKFFALTTQLVDYTGVVDVARGLEAKYAYNLDKANEVISAEMATLGATVGADGKYEFNGEPLTLIFLIRSDGDGTRKPLGDYVANQLESVGFVVDRQYKTSSEAAPIWRGSDPVEGLWNLYTAGWLPAGLTRDEKNQFQQMYLPNSQQGIQPFLSNTGVDPEFQKVGDDLANGSFTSMEQRRDMIAKAMELSLEDSLQVWAIEQLAYSLYQPDVSVTYDLAAGIEASYMGPSNLRFAEKEGGQMKIGTNDLFTEPWNTISGSNWVWDGFIQKSTASGVDFAAAGGLMGDPYTGLAWPQRIDTAEVTVQSDLPVSESLGWVTLKKEDQITVPPDASIDWDAKAQKFISVGEKFPDGLTAKTKSVVTFPSDLFETVKWHDGTPLSVADFIMPTIVFFDRANPDSAIYDESSVPYFKAVTSYFKGFKITSTDPLTIEYYSDLYYADAELDVTTLWPSSFYGLSGENSWYIQAISNLAEENGELAYSADKADIEKVEQTSWIGGPSLEILSKYLDQAASESYVPYEAALGQYLTADQAKAAYENLQQWFKDHGHFWVGTGPYYLDQAFLTEKTLTLKNNTEFPDLANRWESFSEPQLADAQLDGPGQVKVGNEAVFDVNVTFKGQPYAEDDIRQVKYLLYDATGALQSTGEALAVADGQYEVVLDKDVTSKLEAGSNRLEVAVVPTPVAIPAFTSLDFVVVP